MAENWHDNDDFWETLGPIVFNQTRLADAPDEVDGVLELTGLEPPAAFLDLCCGIGRHALELARRGYHITGVDRTAAYLKQARDAAAAEDLAAEWVQAPMQEFVRPGSFDAVLCLYASLGYDPDPAADAAMLRNAWHSLRPGGRLVLEHFARETMARDFSHRDWYEHDGGFYFRENRVVNDFSAVAMTWRVVKNGTLQEYDTVIRLYTPQQLVERCLAAGFQHAQAYGDLHGAPYDVEAENLVVVAHK